MGFEAQQAYYNKGTRFGGSVTAQRNPEPKLQAKMRNSRLSASPYREQLDLISQAHLKPALILRLNHLWSSLMFTKACQDPQLIDHETPPTEGINETVDQNNLKPLAACLKDSKVGLQAYYPNGPSQLVVVADGLRSSFGTLLV